MILKLFFCHVVCLSYVLASPQSLNDKKFSFDDIYNDKFRAKSISVKWGYKDNKDVFTYMNKTGNIMSVNVETNTESVLFTKAELGKSQLSYLNSAMDHVLLGFDIKKNWRHSVKASYKVLKKGGMPVEVTNQVLDFAGWSPDGKSLSYVLDNNLYVASSPFDSIDGLKLTTTGSSSIYNGVPDWLYEEEILSSRVSHWWSPDSKMICYSTIDGTGIGTQSWLVYGKKDNVKETLKTIPYPKAGLKDSKTSKVTLHVAFNFNNGPSNIRTVELTKPDILNEDHYFMQVKWINDDKVFVTWSNRLQTMAYHVFYNIVFKTDPPRSLTLEEPLKSIEIFNEIVKNGWVQVPVSRPIFPNNDESELVTIEPIKYKQSEEKWRMLVRYNKNKNNVYEQEVLNEIPKEVDTLLKIKTNIAYFIRTGKNSTERKLFKYDFGDKSVSEMKANKECNYVSASFSHTGKYYLETCRGPDVPTYILAGVDDKFNQIVYEDNNKLKKAMEVKDTVKKEYITVEKENIYIELYKPEIVTGKKLPLLVYTYAGPGTQEVSEAYDAGGTTKNWLLHMASKYDIAIASIDGRGSKGNGENLKLKMYQKMGVVEIEDQIKGIKKLIQREDIDKDNVAIFGWSYGGFVAANVLADSSEVKCGISVAPVTYKGLYDTAYTERYLGLYKDSIDVYNKTNLQYKAENFWNKPFLVAHGTADDNVHYTNFAQLIKELEMNQIMFTQLTYPDEAHGISTRKMNKHLFHSLTKFLVEDCFQIEGKRSSASIFNLTPVKFIFLFLAFSLANCMF